MFLSLVLSVLITNIDKKKRWRTSDETTPKFIEPKLSGQRCVFVSNLARPKQQGTGDGGSVISVKHRIISLLWLNPFLQPPSITSGVEIVIIPGKAENTHSCKHKEDSTVRRAKFLLDVFHFSTI